MKIRWKELCEEQNAVKFEIRKAYGCRSCAMCNAATYERDAKPATTIYEIKIGIMVNALCPDCIAKLADQLKTEIEI